MVRNAASILAAGLILMAGLEGASAQPASMPTTGSVSPGVVQPAKGLRLDLKARTITLDAEVVLREGYLEFLVCSGPAKAHESIVQTQVKPSLVHASLLMLGLMPGKPARWSGETDDARFLPPQGGELVVRLQWTDAQGRAHSVPAADWIQLAGENPKHKIANWVFVGSSVLPEGGYQADEMGELISVSNFAAAVIDVPFESSSSDELRDFKARTEAIPAVGTAVQVVIEPAPGAEKAPHARVVLEIDRYGELSAEGKALRLADLEGWARDFLDAHAKGQVVLRSAAGALAWDAERAKFELRVGGVRDFDEVRLPPPGLLMPRTAAQARESLQLWHKGFDDPKEYLGDVAEDAEAMLAQTRAELKELKAREALWREYEIALSAALAKYRASTQPASRPAQP